MAKTTTKTAAVSGSAAKQKALLDMLESIASLSEGAGVASTAPAAPSGVLAALKQSTGGNSQQRRKNIRQQNVDMRKALEKLHRKVENARPAAAPAVAPVAEVAAATPAASAVTEVATGTTAKAPAKMSLETIFGKGKKALKSPLGKAAGVIGVAMLIDSLLKGGLNLAGDVGQASLQGQALDAQMAANNPQAAAERAMQPITKAQRDQALMMLMRQMGVKRSNVAEGEAWT